MLNRKRVILGCGYIGKALLEYWHHDKRNLIATTTSADRQQELGLLAGEVVVVQGDDRAALRKLLVGAKQVIVCVAPKTGYSYASVYLNTAKTLCDVLKEGTSVEQLVYTSSTSVYGEQSGAWVTEDTPVKPIGINGEILCETESLYLNAHTPNHVLMTVLRLGGIYGPGREHESRARKMAGKVFPGNGEQFSNWIHQEDAVRAIDWVLKRHLTGIYNVCSDDHPTRQSLYDHITSQLQLPSVLWDAFQGDSHLGNRRVSNEKLRATGFEFHHSAIQ